MVKFRVIAVNKGDTWESLCLETGSEIRGQGQTVEQSVENLFKLINPRTTVVYPAKANISQISKAGTKLVFHGCRPVKHYIMGIVVWNLLLICQYIFRFKNKDICPPKTGIDISPHLL